MIRKVFVAGLAVMATAVLTLLVMIALVQGTILAVSISNLFLQAIAVFADIVAGTALLIGCIYLATRLAVRIWGVGSADFPPLPEHSNRAEPEDGLAGTKQ